MAADDSDFVAPPDDTGGGTTSAPPNRKKLVVGGSIAAAVLIGYILLKRRSSAAASSAGTSAAIPTLIAPSSNQDSVSGSNTSALLNAVGQQGSAFSTGLANLQTELEKAIASNQAAAPVATNPTPATAAPAPTYSTVLAGAPADAGIGTAPIGNVVGEIDQGGGKGVYVTSKGYVYAVGGAQYYGGTNAGQVGGQLGSTISGIKQLAGGGYSLINPTGQTYNFGPGTGST